MIRSVSKCENPRRESDGLWCEAVRFTLQLPTDRVSQGEEFVGAEAIAEMARAAERAGFDAAFVTDHPAPEDRWLRSGGHQALDPFVALSFVAAATTRLRVQTHVLVAAYRNPFLAAKAIASLDVLSRGRVIVGLAAGYLEPEFAALGVDYAERNELTDEAILAMKRIWSGESLSLEGRHFRAAAHTVLPRPLQRPHPPIWIGGNSQRAMRRAVELGDGWLPFPAPARMAKYTHTAPLESEADLAAALDQLRALTARAGRDPLDVCAAPFEMAYGAKELPPSSQLLDTAERFAALGVGWLILTPPARTRAEFLDGVARLGAEVIAKLGSGAP
jgi:probable F420-dependent oxidoreductase